jgi:hypothetical protein
MLNVTEAARSNQLVRRVVFDRLLGPATIRSVDTSDDRNDHRDLVFACGCSAVERRAGRFEVFPCRAHESIVT